MTSAIQFGARRADRWVIAVRVSTEQQEVAQQLDALQDAARRHAAEVVEVVRIEGVSAWDRKTCRLIEAQMLAPIAEGRADTLAVWKLDRVTRQNIKETLAFFDRLEKHLGGKLFSLTEPIISTATMVPETRDLFVSLFAYLANRESNTKSERVKAKRDAKVNRAAAIGQNATWGVGVLATPAQVQAIWAARDAGRSVRAIASAVGVSKSQVSRVLGRPRPATAEAVPVGPSGRPAGVGGNSHPSDGGGLGQAAAKPDQSPTIADQGTAEPGLNGAHGDHAKQPGDHATTAASAMSAADAGSSLQSDVAKKGGLATPAETGRPRIGRSEASGQP